MVCCSFQIEFEGDRQEIGYFSQMPTPVVMLGQDVANSSMVI